MADLDDFFAKKDRKKSKTTKKFPTTTEELVKKIEDTSARTAKATEVRLPQSAPVADGSELPTEAVEQVGFRLLFINTSFSGFWKSAILR